MTLDDLAGQNFASTSEVAAVWAGADPRTIRRMAERGEIPSIRVGVRYMIPVPWLREHLGNATAAEPAPQPVDLDQLADRVADRVAARIFGAFAALGTLTPEMAAARPSPGRAVDAATVPSISHEDTLNVDNISRRRRR